MDKGDRVTITTGNGKGQSGAIFWTGPDKYRGGLRLGVRADDGETYWVSETEVQPATTPASSPSVAPAAVGPTFGKGDRVRYRSQGQEGAGTVFWIGESRSGGGQRLGIRADHSPEDAVWLDARFASPLSEEDDTPPDMPLPPPPTMDLPPPMDDDALDALAAGFDGDGDGDDDIPW